MALLSTNSRLVRVGNDYSAGENIGINDYVISSRNWSPDITYAAESAFQRATGYTDTQISALSGEVSSEVSQLGSDIQYISSVALTAHQSLEGYLTKASGDEYYQPIGSYATVSQLESTSGEIVSLIPSIEGLATEEYVNEQTSGKADKSEIPDVSQFITNASAEQTYQPIGNYLSSNALEGYATQQWVGEQGYITGVDLSNYYTKDETSGKEELAQAFADIPVGDPEVNAYVSNNSATINGTTDLVQNSSGLWNDVAVYQSNSANYLTAHQDLSNYYTTAEANSLSSMLSGAIDYVSANAGGESNVITDDGEFTVLPNTLGTNVTVKYPMDVASYGEPSATPFHEGEWVDWEGNSGADPNNIGSRLGMILHYSDTTTINLEGIQLQVTLPNTISGVNGMCLYYLNPGFGSPIYGPAASNSITSNDNTYSGKYVFNCVGNPFSASTGTYGCYLGLGFSRAASVYGPSSIDARFDTLEYGPATGYEVNLNRYIPSGDNYIAVGVNSATKQTVISAKYSLTGDLNKISPTYTAVTANSATWNSVSSKADKDSLSGLKSEFISDNGTYILHVPSACDIIGTQLSSYDIVGGSVFTSAEFSRRNDYTWQNALICSAFFDVNTQSAYYDFQTDAWGVNIKIVDGNGNNVLTAELEEYSPLTGNLTNLTPGSYTARLECTGFGVDFQNKNTMLYFSGEGISTKTYSGLFIGGGGGGVPQSAFDELKASYDALSASFVTVSSLFATYSGQWLLPNEGEE